MSLFKPLNKLLVTEMIDQDEVVQVAEDVAEEKEQDVVVQVAEDVAEEKEQDGVVQVAEDVAEEKEQDEVVQVAEDVAEKKEQDEVVQVAEDVAEDVAEEKEQDGVVQVAEHVAEEKEQDEVVQVAEDVAEKKEQDKVVQVAEDVAEKKEQDGVVQVAEHVAEEKELVSTELETQAEDLTIDRPLEVCKQDRKALLEEDAEESIASAALPEDLAELNKGCVNMGPEDLELLIVKLKEGLELSKEVKNHKRSQEIRELIWKVNDLRALGVRGIKQLENKSSYQHQKDMKKNKYNKPKNQRKWQTPTEDLPLPVGAEDQDGLSRNNRRNKSSNRRNSRTKRGFSHHRGRQEDSEEQDINLIAKALVDRIIFDALAKLNPIEHLPCSRLNLNAKPFVPSPKKSKRGRTRTQHRDRPCQASAIELELRNLGVPVPQPPSIPQLGYNLLKASTDRALVETSLSKDRALVDIALSLVNDIISTSIQMMINEATAAPKPRNKVLDIEGPGLNLSVCEAELLAAMQEDEACDSIYHDVEGYCIKQEPNTGESTECN